MAVDVFLLAEAGSLALLLVNLVAILAIVNVPMPKRRRALWAAVVLLLPLAGFLVWFAVGPRPGMAHSQRLRSQARTSAAAASAR